MSERLDPIERAKRKPNSLRAAIKAKCWYCAGAGQDPGTREVIRSCTSFGCPLHPHRPFQRDEESEQDGASEPGAA